MKSYKPIIIALCVVLAALLVVAYFVTKQADTSPETTAPTDEPTQPVTEPTVEPTTEPATEPSSEPVTEPTEPPVGWVTDEEGNTYYYTEDSILFTGWLTLDGTTYYLKEDGTLARGILEIEGVRHFFCSDGAEVYLVNPWNPLPEGYQPNLVTVLGWLQCDASCADDFNAMISDCMAAGLNPFVDNAYRTQAVQEYLFNRKIERLREADPTLTLEKARIEAAKVVAIPGTSEHQLGLAFDIVDYSHRNLDESQESTAVTKWLMENCYKYGFILRYPNEKSAETGIIYEPWHYRYVGVKLAAELQESGLCLEEYLEGLH